MAKEIITLIGEEAPRVLLKMIHMRPIPVYEIRERAAKSAVENQLGPRLVHLVCKNKIVPIGTGELIEELKLIKTKYDAREKDRMEMA